MLNWIRQNLTTINIALTLTIATAAAAGTFLQAWITASQIAPFPQVQASSVRALRIEIEDRRTALRKEIQALDALLQDLVRAEAILTGTPLESLVRRVDPWWLTAVKTIAVCFVLLLSLYAVIIAAVIDVILLIFGYDFPLLRAVWNWSWREVTIGWYWERARATGVVIALLFLMLPGSLQLLQEARRERSSQKQGVPDATTR